MAEEDIYTKDGTTDFRNRPAIKNKTGTWKACPYILGNECCERLAYYGINTNLVNYLKFQLNQRNVEAVSNVTNWSGTCYVMPLIGAFLADAYLGRYWTIACFSTIYVFGMTILTMSASIHGLKPHCENNVCHPTGVQTGVFFLGLYLIALGTGGIKPCVSSFGADQFDDSDEAEKKKKSSFFNWFYFSINIGALVASSVLVYIQTNVGWAWGFGIPAVAMAIAVASFFSGTRLYRNQRPGGSPLTRIFQVLVASFRKIRVKVPADKSLLYETADEESAVKGSRKLDHTKQLSFFDKAAVETSSDRIKGSINPWRLSTVTQVEELKSIIRLLPIWATGIIFSAVYSQMGTLFVLQGNTMDLHMGKSFEIPSASLSLFDTISVIFWVPVYDRLIVPFARKFTGHKNGFTQLQRMAIGLVISIIAMLAAGTLELVRLREVKKHNYYELKHMPMSIFWQVPQYFIIGCAEVFTFIGQLEFFYEQAPDAMRSLCSALSLTTAALGNYLSTFLVNIVTDISTRHGNPGWIPDNLNYGHLHYFFWLLAMLSVLNLGAYLMVARGNRNPAGLRAPPSTLHHVPPSNPSPPSDSDDSRDLYHALISEMLCSIEAGDFIGALSSRAARLVLEDSSELSASPEAAYSELLDRVKSFISADSVDDSERACRAILVMCIAVAAFFYFTQCNLKSPVEGLLKRPLPMKAWWDGHGMEEWENWARNELMAAGSDLAAKFSFLQSSSLFKSLQEFKHETLDHFGKLENVTSYWGEKLLDGEGSTIVTVVHLEAGVLEYEYNHLEEGLLGYEYDRLGPCREHFNTALVAAGLELSVTGVLGFRTVHQVEPKAQRVLLVKKCSNSSGGTCTSSGPGLESCSSRISEDSDIFITPKLLENGSGAPLTAVEQAVILAQCLLIGKTAPQDEMQGWDLAPYIEAIDSQQSSYFMEECIPKIGVIFLLELKMELGRQQHFAFLPWKKMTKIIMLNQAVMRKVHECLLLLVD
ncbi:Proton-dependent oligopeptide transporter family [Corchorus capsularis]|uniref:Proton-dependent oligopeptide transporter family n=1 Tax=Corchorus capsularis TaxID=210143 RepID=A0A1R3IRB9_COCAP|nr:Proton-dependent oligopeptide transporter family [Corchorus capsularis]